MVVFDMRECLTHIKGKVLQVFDSQFICTNGVGR